MEISRATPSGLLRQQCRGFSQRLDPSLSEVDFSFRIDCPSEFDCHTPQVCAPPSLSEPELDYLAKDFSSFRRLMLDRLAS